MGSAAIASWVAHVAFWILILYGYLIDELTGVRVALFILLWCVGLFGLSHVPYGPARAMFPSFVAILDIALVFIVFKGDLRIA
jgi:hypothetical protein